MSVLPNNPVSPKYKSCVEKLRRHPLRYICSWRGGTKDYFPIHSHPVIELVYHPSGSGITTLGDGRKIAFEPHGTVLYPAWMRHDQRMDVLGDDICVHIAVPPSSRKVPDLLDEVLYIPPVRAGGTKQADRFVRTEFLHLSQQGSDSTRRVELDLRVTALVVRLLHLSEAVERDIPPPTPETYLDRARQFICNRYATISSVGEVARHVGVSEDYLRHLFAEAGDTSLNRFLNQMRIERAKELLTYSRLPVKEIAALSGFKTERYLSTRFKKLTGTSPGGFRRKSVQQIKSSSEPKNRSTTEKWKK